MTVLHDPEADTIDLARIVLEAEERALYRPSPDEYRTAIYTLLASSIPSEARAVLRQMEQELAQ